MDFLKSAAFFLLVAFLVWNVGWFSGYNAVKHPPENQMCIEDDYVFIERPECHLTAENIVTGVPDGESGMFKKFDQPGVCGLYSCRGDAQGSYECFERNKLKKVP